MTEPQTWVLIGIFGTAMFSVIGLQTASLNRNLTTSINALRESIASKFESMEVGFNARFDAMNSKIDALDRDVQAISRRVFGADT